jgi:WD40 repeat protein
MSTTTPTFRVFVSSTFEDLKAERDALQLEVFPKLRKLCEEHGARFQAIDLRWGVRDEAALNQKTMDICLREIERCRMTGVKPDFLVLLGDRYGWQPLPAPIPADEFERLRPYLKLSGVEALAERWYVLDENAVPPEYILRPRSGEHTDSGVWSKVEQPLRSAMAEAALASGIGANELSKYRDSATHREILAGAGETDDERRHVFGFFRRPSAATDPRLTAVKARVPNHMEFAAGDTAALCDAVYERLAPVIEEQARRFEARPPMEVERDAHNRFAADRARVFHGRRKELEAIGKYLQDDTREILVVRGEPGSGKSALLARASLESDLPGRVIRRFVGATPDSMNGRDLLIGLCHQIAPMETPSEFIHLTEELEKGLAAAGATENLIMFLDALDQLPADDPARDPSWLPTPLPPGVKIVVSVSDGGESPPSAIHLPIEPMSVSEGESALDAWLTEAGRRLQPKQRDKVLAAFGDCRLPLYIKLAAEECRLWMSGTPLADCRLGEEVPGMLDTILERLKGAAAGHGDVFVTRTLGYLAAARHGLTEDEMLEALTADDEVWRDFGLHKHHDVKGRQLPVVLLSRLRLDLEPYLTERAAPGGTVIAFHYRQLAEQAALKQDARHGDLAAYFGTKSDWLDASRNIPNARRGVELPFQQLHAHNWEDLETTLADPEFLEAKCVAGLVYDLVQDYAAALDALPSSGPRMLPYARAISAQAAWLSERPRTTRQQVINYCQWTIGSDLSRFLSQLSPPSEWLQLISERAPTTRTPVHAFRFLGGSALSVAIDSTGSRAVVGPARGNAVVFDTRIGRTVAILKGHGAGVAACALSRGGTLALTSSLDGTVRVFSSAANWRGRLLLNEGTCTCCSLDEDGRFACVGTRQGSVRLFEIASGRVLWEKHLSEGIAWCGFGKSAGELLVAVVDSGTSAIVHFVDSQRTDLKLRQPPIKESRAALVTSQEELTVAYSDGEVWRWSLATGALTHVSRRNRLKLDVGLLTDRMLVLTPDDPPVRGLVAIRSEPEEAVTAIRAPGGLITALAGTRDGRTVISGSTHGEAYLWDVAEWFDSDAATLHGSRDGIFESASSGVVFCGMLPGGRFLSVDPSGMVGFWSMQDRQFEDARFLTRLGKGRLEQLEGDLTALSFGVGVRHEQQPEDRPPKSWSMVRCAFLSDDRSTLGLIFQTGRVLLCDLSRWQVAALAENLGIEIVAGAYSKDLDRVICVDRWSVIQMDSTLRVLATTRLECGPILSAAINLGPKAAVAVLGTENGEVLVWRGDEKRTEEIFKASSPVTACSIGSHGSMAWGTASGELGLAPRKGPTRTVSRGSGAGVNQCTVLHDGRWLASVAQDKTLLVHSTEKLALHGAYPLPDPGTALSVADQGPRLIIGTREGEVQIVKILQSGAVQQAGEQA